ncbi:MAG: SusD/RagB family nutrient-binding outer membrane lipoprotein, partial [Bacteroidetes bacterium]|nr:SusD/RagB family nutrient-binding outer membrane lipoprotein [Bacteroidota bacterium]
MKNIKKYNRIFLALILIFTIGSCTKDFEEMNQNPNSPVDVPAINIFTHVITDALTRNNNPEVGGWIQHTYLGVWCQQWCKVQYIDEDWYAPRNMSGYFEDPYTRMLLDIEIILQKTTEDIENEKEVTANKSLQGAAKIMRAWIFHFLTDIWGDIPYTEALQGLDEEGTITPVYDTQESVYMALLAELEEANQLLSGTTVSFGSGDIIFDGDPVKWRKFANSLKLRILNRCAGTPWTFTYDMVAPQADVTTSAGAVAYSGADADIGAILGSGPIIESNDDNVLLTFPGLPYRNPIFNTLYDRTDQAISETMVDWLEARNDPRLPVYAQETPNHVADPVTYPDPYVGQQNGRAHAAAHFPSISLLGLPVAYDENAPVFILTYEEVEFIKAEYYMRTGNDALAQAAYEAGIAASMDKWGVIYDKATYYDGVALVDWALAANDGEKYQRICEQKWAAIYGQGVQAYAEVRRTGFPARIFEYELEGAFYPNLGLPIRLTYSLNEATYNAVNLQAAKTRQNVELAYESMFSQNGIQSQIWWHTR